MGKIYKMNSNKNLIFAVTHGRTGTTMVTEVFKIFDNVRSEHEPEPNYASVFPHVKSDPRNAIKFLEKKLSTIDSFDEENYIETSNVFGKGFLIPLLRMGRMPGLLFLNRDFRETARSLYVRGSIPVRSKMGRHFSADPSVPGSLPIFSPESLSDYQMCFWGVLDSYYRQLQAESVYKKEGGCYCWVNASDFHDFEKAVSIGSTFGLGVSDKEYAKKMHSEIVGVHHNPNKGKRNTSEVSAFSEEIEVIDRVAFYDPEFVESCLSSKYLSSDVVSYLRQD
ncbi:hypothetical protein [Aidingimonas lacisalsi]|uniref:hypothetical protein n=1 Tax=Aidingimonas lacisalsi TaxID=2604086 RepID=UPI001375F5FD|nr:hypothetical protein [Aidingimonas lacisalsi]